MILPVKLRGFIDLIRPFTLFLPLIGGVAGGLMGFNALPASEKLLINDTGGLPFLVFNTEFPFISLANGFLELMLGVTALIMITAGSNALNGVYDAEIDAVNKPYRPIPTRIITKDEARSLAWVLYLLALWRAMLVGTATGDGIRQFGGLVVLIMLITLAYSVPPIRLKKRLWISNLAIAFTRGLLGFVAAWNIFGDPWSTPDPWIIGGVFTIFLFGAVTTKDFNDVEGDQLFGIRTLPVVYGAKKAAIISGPFFLMPFFLIFIGLSFGLLDYQSNWLGLFAIWGLILAMLLQTAATKTSRSIENSYVWLLTYFMMMGLQISFFIIYVL